MIAQLVSYLFKQNDYKDEDVIVIVLYTDQVRKFRDCLGKIFSIQLSNEDKDAIAMLDSLKTIQEAIYNIVRKSLIQNIRIATIKDSSRAMLMLINGQFPRRRSQSHCSFIDMFK